MGEEPLAVLECQQPVLFSCSEGNGMTTFIISLWRMALCCQVETGTQGFQEYKKHAKRSRIRTNLMYFNTAASWSSTPRSRISFAPPTPFLWVPLQNCSASDSRIFPGHVLDLCWIRQRNEFTMQMSRQSSLAPNCNFLKCSKSLDSTVILKHQEIASSSEGSWRHQMIPRTPKLPAKVDAALADGKRLLYVSPGTVATGHFWTEQFGPQALDVVVACRFPLKTSFQS